MFADAAPSEAIQAHALLGISVACLLIYNDDRPIPDLPILEHANDDLDTCSIGFIRGLKADGDGFLTVGTGSGLDFRKFHGVYNGNRVWVFDAKGP